MRFIRSETFLHDFRRLSSATQRRVERTLRVFANNPYHPSLRTKKMQPRESGIFEVRVTQSCRMTFHFEGGDVVLRRVGLHDVLRRP